MHRYLSEHIAKDLRKKLVILSGPRQVGKTTLAKTLMDSRAEYLNWDVRSDQRVIRKVGWPKDASLVILDELHKYRTWKSFLKGVVDEHENNPNLLVTGSARLEIFRKGGDALTGRCFSYRLHPIDLSELSTFKPELPAAEQVSYLLEHGGFPESLLCPEDSERLLNDRLDFVLREDLRDLSKTSASRSIELLVELLRERAGSSLNYSNLAKDLSVAPATVKSWVELLEKLYLVFLVPAYSRRFSRSIRKEHKLYFYDCSAAYDDHGARLENLAACSLLKYCHFRTDTTGVRTRLYYFRDKEKREVDFIVTEKNVVKWCIEVKSSDDTLHKPLLYFQERARAQEAFQLVYNLDRAKEIKGVKIVSLADWLRALPTTCGTS